MDRKVYVANPGKYKVLLQQLQRLEPVQRHVLEEDRKQALDKPAFWQLLSHSVNCMVCPDRAK